MGQIDNNPKPNPVRGRLFYLLASLTVMISCSALPRGFSSTPPSLSAYFMYIAQLIRSDIRARQESGLTKYVRYSKDGRKLFAVTGDDLQFRVWDIASRRHVATLKDSIYWNPGDFGFSSDDSMFTLCSNSKPIIHVWRTEDYRMIKEITYPAGARDLWISKVAFTRDGRYFVVDPSISKLLVFDTNDWLLKTDISGQRFQDVVPDGPGPEAIFCVPRADNHSVEVIDVATGGLVDKLGPFDCPLDFVATDHDGRRLCLGNEAVLIFFDLQEKKEILRLVTTKYQGYGAFTFDSRYFVYLANSNETYAVRVAEGEKPVKLSTSRARKVLHFVNFALHPSTHEAIVSCGPVVEIIDVATLDVKARFSIDSETVVRLGYSPDGRCVAIGALGDEWIRIHDAGSGQPLHKLYPLDFPTGSFEYARASGARVSIQRLHWTRLIEVYYEQKARFLSAGKVMFTSLALTADERYLATGFEDGTIHVWDFSKVKDMKKNRMLEVDWSQVVQVSDSGIVSLAWAPESEHLYCADGRGDIFVCSLNQGIACSLLAHAGSRIQSMKCSPDGRWLACAREDGVVSLVGTGDGAAGTSFPHGAAAVLDASFNSDGGQLVSSDTWGRVRVWDIVSGRLMKILQTSEAPVMKVSFDIDPRYILTVDAVGTYRKLDLSTESVVEEEPGVLHSHIPHH